MLNMPLNRCLQKLAVVFLVACVAVFYGVILKEKNVFKSEKDLPSLSQAPKSDGVSDAFMDAEEAAEFYGKLNFLPGYETIETVPRVFLAAMPAGIQVMEDANSRKTLFVQVMLPLILKVNEEITADRERVLALKARNEAGKPLASGEIAFLEALTRRYGLEEADFTRLLRRVDVIPPSLALAQAAEESGWGTSRFARHGNALFGQRTSNPAEGIAPQNRPKQDAVLVRTFPTLLDGVRAYADNLNRHRAYRDFRVKREAMRENGQILDGGALAETLLKYSERAEQYVASVRRIMRINSFETYDDLSLFAAEHGGTIRSKLSERVRERGELASRTDVQLF